MPKATAVFDADNSRLSNALARINGRMRRRRLQSHRLQPKRRRGGAHVAVAGVDGGASFLRRAGEMERVGGTEEDRGWEFADFPASSMGEAFWKGQPCPQTGLAVGLGLSAKEIRSPCAAPFLPGACDGKRMPLPQRRGRNSPRAAP